MKPTERGDKFIHPRYPNVIMVVDCFLYLGTKIQSVDMNNVGASRVEIVTINDRICSLVRAVKV